LTISGRFDMMMLHTTPLHLLIGGDVATRTSTVTEQQPRLALATLGEDIQDVEHLVSVYLPSALAGGVTEPLLHRWLTDGRPADIDDVAAILDIQPAMVRRLASNHRKAVADGRPLDSRCLIAPTGFETYATNQIIVFGWLTGRLKPGTLTPVTVLEAPPGPGEYLDELDRMLHEDLEALIVEYLAAPEARAQGVTEAQMRTWLTDDTLLDYGPTAALFGVEIPTLRKRVNAYRHSVRAGLPPDQSCFIRPNLSLGTRIRAWARNRSILHGWRNGWIVPGTLTPIRRLPTGRPAA
jgi:hypothetical protein